MQKDKLDFTIYVVGGMATGKSTLINAMIGKRLMPYNYTSHRQYIKHFPSTHYDYTHLPDYIRLEIEYDLIMAKNNPNKKEG